MSSGNRPREQKGARKTGLLEHLEATGAAGQRTMSGSLNLVVDTLGLLLMVHMVPANMQDRDGADHVVRAAVDKYPSLEKLYVDSGYSGTCAVHPKQEHQIDVEVVRHPANRNVGRWVTPDQGELFPVLADSLSVSYLLRLVRSAVQPKRTFPRSEARPNWANGLLL